MKADDMVLCDDGRLGRLAMPRGCYCGTAGEPCWDLYLLATTEDVLSARLDAQEIGDFSGMRQAHGGTFRHATTAETQAWLVRERERLDETRA